MTPNSVLPVAHAPEEPTQRTICASLAFESRGAHIIEMPSPPVCSLTSPTPVPTALLVAVRIGCAGSNLGRVTYVVLLIQPLFLVSSFVNVASYYNLDK